jgi:ribosomal RNA assembly protein
MEIELTIPEDRIGVLIGKEGEIKKRIEELSGCKVKISSKTGVVKIQCEDPYKFMRVQDVVKAIAHGFNPEVAMKLLEDDMVTLDVIDLTSYVSDKHLQRIKGRIIGKEGSMRKTLEDLLNVHVSVYGKTVAILGDVESVAIAREAIEMLIDGAQHSTVIRFLERKRRELKMRGMEWF